MHKNQPLALAEAGVPSSYGYAMHANGRYIGVSIGVINRAHTMVRTCLGFEFFEARFLFLD